MRRRLSLRARLILGVIALAAVGLVAADFATYSELRSFLVTRTDGSLDAAHIAVEGALFHQHSGGPGDESSETPSADGTPDLAPLIAAAPGEYVELRKLDGTVVRGGSAPRFPGGQTAPPPLLPAHIVLPAAAGQGERVVYFTARSKDGDDRYRVRASIEPQAKNYVLIVAQPLTDVDSTLHRLLLIALSVTALVLAGI
ncbi:MAG: two-component system, OmpR family, sensor kinase, partial [Gaiellaceae bacterium]|nr:two-component system, OmpR family, sensor kinase [Gaiellaceae bacterium]